MQLLYTPCPSPEEARRIGGILVEEKLVACANILPGILSIYEWEGRREESQETLLLCKTTEKLAESARTRIAELHPYTCPCILTLKADANPAFAAWVEGQVA